MKNYELTYLIPIELSEEERKNLSERVNAFVQENGGILKEFKMLSQQNLAQPIKKRVSAFLITLDFLVAPEKIIEIEKKVRSQPEIFRYLITAKKIIKIDKIIPRRLLKKPTVALEKLIPHAGRRKKVELQEIDKKLKEILGE